MHGALCAFLGDIIVILFFKVNDSFDKQKKLKPKQKKGQPKNS
jgi:hypothetical protein|tara:strand:- start:63 stop:191 length:129 start_codon:yes stop_codon:yes gene_type:complete